MLKKLNIGLLYLSLHNQLRKKMGSRREISRREFNIIIGKHFLIPKGIKYKMIKEMERLRLIKQIDRDTLKILDIGGNHIPFDFVFY